MQTPQSSMAAGYSGLKEVFKTPASGIDINMVGVKEMLKTPVATKDVAHVQLSKTPAAFNCDNEEFSGVKELKTPAASYVASDQVFTDRLDSSITPDSNKEVTPTLVNQDQESMLHVKPHQRNSSFSRINGGLPVPIALC